MKFKTLEHEQLEGLPKAILVMSIILRVLGYIAIQSIRCGLLLQM